MKNDKVIESNIVSNVDEARIGEDNIIANDNTPNRVTGVQSIAGETKSQKRRRIQNAALMNVHNIDEETGDQEQSLVIGSSAYDEYVHDAHMRSNTDFDTVKEYDIEHTNSHYVKERLEKNKSRDRQKQSRSHNARIRTDMRNRNITHQSSGIVKTYNRKSYNHIKKEDLEDDAMDNAMEKALETETKTDDKRLEKKMPKALEKIKYDDGITEDDYLRATSKAARRYL